MPRDLEQEKPAPPVTLTESPNSVTTERTESPDQQEEAPPTPDRQRQFVIIPEHQQVKAPTNLHPYTRPLTVSDLDSCIALENIAFTNPEERATKEKVSSKRGGGDPFPGKHVTHYYIRSLLLLVVPGYDFDANALS